MTAKAGAGRVLFQLACTASYSRMCIAMVNAIRHYHPGAPIVLYAPPAELDAFAPLSDRARLVPEPAHGLPGREFPSLVWTKLWAFLQVEHDVVVVLDVDQIMYRPVYGLCERFLAGSAVIGATADDEAVDAQFVSIPPALSAIRGRPALSSGTLLVKPSLPTFEIAMQLAARYAEHGRYPEQAILNALVHTSGGWLEFGEELQMYHLSPSILDPDHESCLVHFYTPRPPFFGPSPRREREDSYEDACRDFLRRTGRPYPEARIRRDFHDRLENWIR